MLTSSPFHFSSSGSSSNSNKKEDLISNGVKCDCDKPAVLRTSTAANTPERKFFCCPSFPSPGHCKYFSWLEEHVIYPGDLSRKFEKLHCTLDTIQNDIQLISTWRQKDVEKMDQVEINITHWGQKNAMKMDQVEINITELIKGCTERFDTQDREKDALIVKLRRENETKVKMLAIMGCIVTMYFGFMLV